MTWVRGRSKPSYAVMQVLPVGEVVYGLVVQFTRPFASYVVSVSTPPETLAEGRPYASTMVLLVMLGSGVAVVIESTSRAEGYE